MSVIYGFIRQRTLAEFFNQLTGTVFGFVCPFIRSEHGLDNSDFSNHSDLIVFQFLRSNGSKFAGLTFLEN